MRGYLSPTRVVAFALIAGAVSCNGAVDPSDFGFDANCDLFSDNLADGGVSRDGIPALDGPLSVSAEEGGFLAPQDRVLGVEIAGQARAYPLIILWWHEIINDVVGNTPIVVTYCPLTGSGLVFDARVGGEASTYGVSGLLFENNLMMFDRVTESLWPQMLASARCGERIGTPLTQVAVVETTWEEWKRRHPETTVTSLDTAYPRSYGSYPYGNYYLFDNDRLYGPSSEYSDARPPKEPVLGVALNGAASAYPFAALNELGPSAAINDRVGGQDIVVTWHTESGTARAFERSVGGQTLQFMADPDDATLFVDDLTGSVWTGDGLAISGDLVGERLAPIEEAYVAFWFAWSVFYPETEIGVS